MKVSVITPSCRPEMLNSCIDQFLKQDYEDKEMIIVSDVTNPKTGGRHMFHYILKEGEIGERHMTLTLEDNFNVGRKRNFGCEKSTGDIIIHMDDDDFYSKDWLTRSVAALIESNADLVGLRDGYFYNTNTQIGKLYQYALRQGYCLGATMCYWRKTWERNKFNETVRHGEDSLFCANAGHIYNHEYIDGFTALIHGKNTTSQTAFQTMRIVDKNTIPYVKHRSQLQGNIQ